MREVVIELPEEDLDALRAFLNFHKGDNETGSKYGEYFYIVLLHEWLGGREKIKYIFKII